MTSSSEALGISRRSFLKGSAASLLIGMHLPILAGKQAVAAVSNPSGELTANAFLRISADNTVTVLIKHIEFGQGAFTGLATLAAEELDADWTQVRAEHAVSNVDLYANSYFGVQGTGGSTGLANSFMTMRKAGATARQLLISAAANKWGVPEAGISVSKGVISEISGDRTATFGELIEIASELPRPSEDPVLKSPDDFVLIGTDVPKLDTVGKSTGTAKYTMDLFMDDMVVAVIARPPAFGGTVKSFDASRTKTVTGVIDVKDIGTGVAVYADTTFNAIKGRRELDVEWDLSEAETRSSDTLYSLYREALGSEGKQVAGRGDLTGLSADPENRLELELEFPFLAHAPMEPLDAVLMHEKGKVTAWFGSQIPTADQNAIAAVFGIERDDVTIHTQLAGGSFGRRTQQDSGLAAEAARVAQAFGEGIPVKLIWTREDDIQGGRYRPLTVHRLSGAIDKSGKVLGWKHDIATQSIVANSPFEGLIQEGFDPTSVEGAHNQPYAVPHLDVRLHDMQNGVPVLWWRSVGHTHTGYAVETFIDALLEKAGKDPVEGRLELLVDHHPREAKVLEVAAEMAERAGPTPEGRVRGVAMVKSFGSYVAQVAEISKGDDGLPKVHRVWCSVDCGLAVNTNVIKAQLEGGIGYGLDAMLYGELSLGEGGKVEQSNFHNYRVLRINEMPEIDVEIIKSDQPPTGVGEIGVPPIAPAVANAWRRLTGQYVTKLPFAKGVNEPAA